MALNFTPAPGSIRAGPELFPCTNACSVFRPPSLVVERGWSENARQVRSPRLSGLGPARELADPQVSAHPLPAGELAAKVTTKLIVAEAGNRVRQRVSSTAGIAAGREDRRARPTETAESIARICFRCSP